MSQPTAALSRPLTIVMAAAIGIIVANIYFAQPLIALIGPDIGLGDRAASLVVTLTQLGYAAGLLLLVPLADRTENRRLTGVTALCGAAALAVTAVSGSASVFLVACVVLGLASTSVQMLVPLAAHLAAPEERGRAVGNVMSGLLLGILLARPFASLVAYHFGWRAVFAVAAVVDIGVALVLWRVLPRRQPDPAGSYGGLLASLWTTLRDNPILQRRAFYQACLFACFSLFWTAISLHLAGPAFRLTQDGIALFALCGASGALVAPLAGRLADRGHTVPATYAAFAIATLGFALSGVGAGSLLLLGLSAIVVDAGVQLHQITAQRVIYGLPAEIRGRVTALYVALLFVGGALGSAVASPVFTAAGWRGVALVGTGFGLIALFAYGWHQLRSGRE